ncbi:MAG: hypothetical protein K9I84_03615 [Leadbetterella sp.]|nr:hypothetical protein [Leadbetterella sp.]
MKVNEFEKVMAANSEEALIDIVTKLRSDYQTNAIVAAEEELKKRGLWRKEFVNFKHPAENVDLNTVYDPKKAWKIVRSTLIIFGLFHLIVENIFGLKGIDATYPVIANYFISSWWIKWRSRGKKISNPSNYALLISSTVFGLRLTISFIIGILFHIELFKYGIIRKNGWDKKTETALYQEIKIVTDSLGISGVKSVLLSNCFVQKMKSIYPEGIEHMDKIEISANTEKVFEDCMKENKIFWTKQVELEMEKEMAKKMLNYPNLQNLDEFDKVTFIKCFISKLKERFPDGIVDLPKEISIEVGNECASEIKN